MVVVGPFYVQVVIFCTLGVSALLMLCEHPVCYCSGCILSTNVLGVSALLVIWVPPVCYYSGCISSVDALGASCLLLLSGHHIYWCSSCTLPTTAQGASHLLVFWEYHIHWCSGCILPATALLTLLVARIVTYVVDRRFFSHFFWKMWGGELCAYTLVTYSYHTW